MKNKLQQIIKGQTGQAGPLVIVGIVLFLIGILLIALSLTYVASSPLLLFGIVFTGGGVALLYLAAKL